MNKQQFKFLKRLNGDIEKACPILDTDRDHFMPALQRFLKVVSFGMELGLSMKDKSKDKKEKAILLLNGTKKTGKVVATAANKRSKTKRAKVNLDRSKKVMEAIQVMFKKNETLRLNEITAKLGKLVSDLGSPAQNVWSMLRSSSSVVESVPGKKGLYRLKKVKSHGKAVHLNGKSINGKSVSAASAAN